MFIHAADWPRLFTAKTQFALTVGGVYIQGFYGCDVMVFQFDDFALDQAIRPFRLAGEMGGHLLGNHFVHNECDTVTTDDWTAISAPR